MATAFPSGRSSREVKLADTALAVEAGAGEIDMVIDRGAFLTGRYGAVYEEIVAVREACGPGRGRAHLKVILETGELGGYDDGAPGVLAGPAGRRRRDQDLHRQDLPGGHAAGGPGDAAGGSRLAPADR